MPNTLIISVIQHPTLTQLIQQWVDLGYTRVPMVLEPCEFAVRGGILDIFATNQSHPIRIEYDDDQIIRMTSFNVHSQKSISNLTETQIAPIDHKNAYFLELDSEPSEDVVAQFSQGDFVVHEDYGIGCYQGLKHMRFNSREGEYLFIQYRGEDKLYVPLEHFNRIHLYSGSDIVPELNSLSDGSWQKTKTKTRKALEELAEDVYLMYKLRQNAEGFSHNEDTVWQIDLERSFPFKDTPDQTKVTKEIKRDMESAKPMDRVLCGDVGYGKTEIIVRAAFKAAENNKQTAILVPTTILADQHFRTFTERFASFKHKIEMLSRFRNPKEQREIIAELKTNKIKVIIGTHRLLNKEIQFADLGLLVIDEEQRFGVSHKEKIKQLKHNVDVISISATPIPRTLYMALTGARDFSILNTPPVARKPVMTSVAPYHEDIVKKAILNEIESGGQVFYLYNNVEKIETRFARLKRLIPDLRIGIGHGQMKESDLEQVIFDFIHKKYQVLLCTTIIENGVDIPNANTIIVENAHLFGLSQIHQIRGRVGRTPKQAYAYLLYPNEETLSSKAKKRLQAVKEYAALGVGYKLALKDLEIRGAGTLLGKKQHGHMTAVGFSLYCKLLEESIQKMKKIPIIKKEFIIEKVAYIPPSYIESERERLAIYQRLVRLNSLEQWDDLNSELNDRYGKIPKIMLPLLEMIRDQL